MLTCKCFHYFVAEVRLYSFPRSRTLSSFLRHLVTAIINSFRMFTASVGIAGEGQRTGVQNCDIRETLVFFLGSRTNHDRYPHRKHKNQLLVQRLWIFSEKTMNGKSYLVKKKYQSFEKNCCKGRARCSGYYGRKWGFSKNV